MSLRSGDRLGPYDVLAPIGAGGMGEVYRARDTRLQRSVALKVLPAALAHDPDRLARFKREAQVLASLNHPHIAQIHGFEDAGPVQALVMELVEGPTLADWIATSPSVSDVLRVARQIAEALAAAHDQGVIHRDLKPANVKLTNEGVVKVLDFGLAKPSESDQGSAAGQLSDSPTITTPAATAMGLILGTAAYMAPEQAKGHRVDKRADVWAFGCVLFEMLAGRRAFEGGDVADTLAAVLRSEPDWSALPADTPPAVRAVLRRCLEKDRRRRLADFGDLLMLMDELSDAHRAAALPVEAAATPPRHTRWFVPAAAALAGAVLAASIVWGWRPAPDAAPTQRLTVILPEGDQFSATGRTFVAIAPDASRLAYIANQQLYVRPLNQLTPSLVAGSSGATSPFFSPDSQQIGFWQGGELKKVSVAGGAPQVIGPAGNPFGVSWAADGTILFSDGANGIKQLQAEGGQPTVIVPPDEDRATLFISPELLPGGRAVLFTRLQTNVASGSGGVGAEVVVHDLGSGQQRVIVEDGAQGRFLAPGHLLFTRQATLWASAFDPRTATRAGTSISMVEGIFEAATIGAVASVGANARSAQFDVSSTGMLVYLEQDATVVERSLVWVDREGRETPLPLPDRSYAYPRISPDGRQAAVDIRDEGQDVWIVDLRTGTNNLRKLTFDPAPEIAPVWTRDGQRVVFFRSGAGLISQSANGAGAPEQLLAGTASVMAPMGFTRDDQLIFNEDAGSGWAVKRVHPAGRQPAELVPASRYTAMNSALSPDGRWLVYEAADPTRGGRAALYVRPFPDVGAGLWQIECEDCTRPLWARDGRELFFLSGGTSTTGLTSIWTVSIGLSTTFEPSPPRKLFEGHYFAQLFGRAYDISPDAQRFLMVKTSAAAANRARIVIVDNWAEELKRLVPAAR